MHGSCKFNKSYQIHKNKTSWVQHRSKPLMTDTNIVTECTPLAIVLLIALYYIVSDEIKCAPSGLSCECSKIWTAIWLLYFGGSFLDMYFLKGVLLRDHGDVASPYLLLSTSICWNSGPSAVRAPSYKNRGKIGESIQLLCNLAKSPFLLAASSVGPRSSSLDHVGGEASKGGDGGVGPWCEYAGFPHGEPRGSMAMVMPLHCGDGTCHSQ